MNPVLSNILQREVVAPSSMQLLKHLTLQIPLGWCLQVKAIKHHTLLVLSRESNGFRCLE